MEERDNISEECAPSHDTQIKTTAFNSREEEHTDVTYEEPISSRYIEASSQREQANSTVQDENITLKNAPTTDSSRKQAASFTTRVMLIILAVAILLNTTMCVWLAISFQRAGLLSSVPSSSSTKSNMMSAVARNQFQLDTLQNTITQLAESFSKSRKEHNSTMQHLSHTISSTAAGVIRSVNSTVKSMVLVSKKNENAIHRMSETFNRNADGIVNSLMKQDEALQNLSLTVMRNAGFREKNKVIFRKLLDASNRNAEKFDYVFRNLSIKRNLESMACGGVKIEDALHNLSFIVNQSSEDMIQAFQTLTDAVTRNAHALDNFQLKHDEAFRNLSLRASEIVDIVTRSVMQNTNVVANSTLKQEQSIMNLTHEINKISQVIAKSEMMFETALQSLVPMVNRSEDATALHRMKQQEALGNASLSVTGSLSSGNDVIRLANGLNKYSGRVEIYYSGTWGTVCSHFWDIDDATVVCRMLGFPGAVSAPQRAFFGGGTGMIWLNKVRCTGTETSLFNCSKESWGIQNCSHGADASVICTPNLRLVHGNNSYSGRVEVFHEGEWGRVCDNEWDINDANVVCRMLGLPSAVADGHGGRIGPGIGKVWLDNVRCMGKEMSILDCANRSGGGQSCGGNSKDAAVECRPPSLRLANGLNLYSGRVEVLYYGVWGTVSGYQWDINDAKVVCRMLGFQDAIAAPHHALFGEGTGRAWLSNVRCAGTETSLFSCYKNSWGESSYGHDRDASVVCTPPSIRLINGMNSYSGRVEVQYNGTWGTICDDNWDINDANVICRMFGFANATSAPTGASFEQGTGKIWFNNVSCEGTEESIWNCTKNSSSDEMCSHDKDASVVCQPIAIRLVDGINSYSGRVEVNYLGEWGTVSDYQWDINDAKVVCRMLGLRDAMAAPRRAFFGEGTGMVWLNYVRCAGTETSLFSCSKDSWGESSNGHRWDASVVCTPPSVRLINGTNSYSGRVEVQYNGTWGTICDDNWDINDAKVICRMFGFANATSAPTGASFKQGTGKIWFNNVSCEGTEESIWNCTKNSPSDEMCSHDKDASVVCQPIAIRLVDGNNSYSGRVEVNYLGEWGTVSDFEWDINDAKVVCRMLGFRDAIAAPHRAFFGEGAGKAWLSNVRCTGTETSLFSCSKDSWGESSHGHHRDASVVCTPPTVRLINGTSSYSGRVEVQYNGKWGTICDDNWDINDANVICRMFGFANATSAPTGASYGQGTGKIWFNNVSCEGTEKSIWNCTKNSPSDEMCSHDNDASVVCQPIAIRLVDGKNSYSGRVEVNYMREWGTINDAWWDINDAKVVCRMLGFQDAIAAPRRAFFGEGTGRAWLSYVRCAGTETSLFSCSKDSWGESSYGHDRDASVVCTPPSVRLIDGTNSYSGRVEVQYNGTWGTICDDNWDINDANVICRMFGFANATSAPTGASFEQGTGKICFNNVSCKGTEESIWNCTKNSPSDEMCSHDKDASVVCQPIAIRLVDGNNSYSGRVEVNYLGKWGTVSDGEWDINDAKVVCRMLGSQDAIAAPRRALFGEGTGMVWLSYVRCAGTETSLFSCSKDSWGESSYGHHRDASVVCTPPSVRLINGKNSYSGRVEVQYNGTWGTICDDNWDINDANVICRMFGFANATSATRDASFGQGTGKIWINNVSCAGTEASIWNCTKNISTNNGECDHDKDASVVCQPIVVRLVDGINSYSGRVEVNYLGEWGTVCQYGWDINDANVVCRMLGFLNATSALGGAHFGRGRGRIWLSHVRCTGTEKSIWDCAKNSWGEHYCGHYADASVVCTP